MRLNNYLNEVSTGKDIEQLKQDCSIFINDLKKQKKSFIEFIYSGRKGSNTIIKKDVRQNRRPLDTPEGIHDMIDNEFFDEFGYKPRSSSLFCYVDYRKTMAYGKTYVIFPIDKYKLIWSPKVTDLYDHLSKKFRPYIRYVKSGGNTRPVWLGMDEFEQNNFNSYQEFKEYLESGEAKQDLKSYIYDLVRSYKVSDASDIPNIPTNNEIMLMTKSYYGVQYKEFDLVYKEIFGE